VGETDIQTERDTDRDRLQGEAYGQSDAERRENTVMRRQTVIERLEAEIERQRETPLVFRIFNEYQMYLTGGGLVLVFYLD